jgi:hypothetical protein
MPVGTCKDLRALTLSTLQQSCAVVQMAEAGYQGELLAVSASLTG